MTTEQLQILEKNLQTFNMQKHQFQQQMAEAENALKELEKTTESYKIIGNIMIKTNPEELKKELFEKNEQFKGRIETLEVQEKKLHEKIKELRNGKDTTSN